MLTEIGRSILVFAHLLFFSGAIVLVLWTDLSILKNGVRAPFLHLITRGVLTLFLLLWITGLSILYIDTGFHIAPISSNSKVLIKLVCVFVLTFNGILIHVTGLKILTSKDRMRRSHATYLCVIGAVSTTNWILAGYIGSANMLAEYPFKILLLLYAGILIAACVCGCCLDGFVRTRFNWHRAHATLNELGIEPVLNPSPSKSCMPIRTDATS